PKLGQRDTYGARAGTKAEMRELGHGDAVCQKVRVIQRRRTRTADSSSLADGAVRSWRMECDLVVASLPRKILVWGRGGGGSTNHSSSTSREIAWRPGK